MDLASTVIETPRTRLSAFRPEDIQALNAIRNHHEVQRYLPRKERETLAETQRLMQKMVWDNQSGAGINFGIRLKDTDALLGYMGFWKYDFSSGTGELGYLLAREHWNRGLASEALAGFLGFTTANFHFKHFNAVVHRENRYSIRLLEKNGFSAQSHNEEEEEDEAFVTYQKAAV